jgi:hypothetical protein
LYQVDQYRTIYHHRGIQVNGLVDLLVGGDNVTVHFVARLRREGQPRQEEATSDYAFNRK